MDLTTLSPAEINAFWVAADQRTDVRIAAALRDFSTNYRPRGLTPIAYTVDSPSPSSTKPIGDIDIIFPCTLVAVSFRSTDIGSAILDLKARRPGDIAGNATSLFGGDFPTITASTDALKLAGPTWTTNIEATNDLGSATTLYPYLIAVSGFGHLTVNLWVRGY